MEIPVPDDFILPEPGWSLMPESWRSGPIGRYFPLKNVACSWLKQWAETDSLPKKCWLEAWEKRNGKKVNLKPTFAFLIENMKRRQYTRIEFECVDTMVRFGRQLDCRIDDLAGLPWLDRSVRFNAATERSLGQCIPEAVDRYVLRHEFIDEDGRLQSVIPDNTLLLMPTDEYRSFGEYLYSERNIVLQPLFQDDDLLEFEIENSHNGCAVLREPDRVIVVRVKP